MIRNGLHIYQVSSHVFDVRFLGQDYRMELGDARGMWDSPIVTYREHGKWNTCTEPQARFIVKVVMSQWSP